MSERFSKRHDQRGFVLPMAAVFFILAIPIVGLVIDVGIEYMIQTKLQMAVDAATLAGARSLSRGNDDPTQQANAQTTAQVLFNRRFSAGLFGRIPHRPYTALASPKRQTSVR